MKNFLKRILILALIAVAVVCLIYIFFYSKSNADKSYEYVFKLLTDVETNVKAEAYEGGGVIEQENLLDKITRKLSIVEDGDENFNFQRDYYNALKEVLTSEYVNLKSLKGANSECSKIYSNLKEFIKVSDKLISAIDDYNYNVKLVTNLNSETKANLLKILNEKLTEENTKLYNVNKLIIEAVVDHRYGGKFTYKMAVEYIAIDPTLLAQSKVGLTKVGTITQENENTAMQNEGTVIALAGLRKASLQNFTDASYGSYYEKLSENDKKVADKIRELISSVIA